MTELLLLTFILILLIYVVFLADFAGLLDKGNFANKIFKRRYNCHFLFIPPILILGICIVLRFNNYSPTANRLWKTDATVLLVRNTLGHLRDNINQYTVVTTNKRFVEDSVNNITIINKSTGDKHQININSKTFSSFIEWYKNDKLVFRNGTKHSHNFAIADDEYTALHNDIYVCDALNYKVYKAIKEVLDADYHNCIAQRLGDTNLLSTEQVQTKTMEITAPVNTTIIGTVSENNKIIHTETL